jgi:hypothetical protein
VKRFANPGGVLGCVAETIAFGDRFDCFERRGLASDELCQQRCT